MSSVKDHPDRLHEIAAPGRAEPAKIWPEAQAIGGLATRRGIGL